jgi:AcrR family transcriptional regulator
MRRRTATATNKVILEAARRLLENAGALVTLEEVAVAAGVSRQAVYLHFGSRTKLLLSLVSYIGESQRIPERTRALEAASSAIAALDAAVDLHAKFNGHVLAVANALDVARRTDSSAAEAWADRMKMRRRGARQLIERLAAEGRLFSGLSVAEATDVVWVLLSVRLWEDLVVVRGWSRQRYARHVKRIMRKAVVAGPHDPATAARKRRRHSAGIP